MDNFARERLYLPIHPRAVLQAGIALLLVLQLLYISQRFDAYTLVMDGAAQGWRISFGYMGQVAKIAVLFLVILCVLLQRELRTLWKIIQFEANVKRAGIYFLPQILSYWFFLQSSAVIFDDASDGNQAALSEFLLWCVELSACLLCWTLMSAPIRFWLEILARYRKRVLAAALISVIVWLFTAWANRLWTPLSTLTFLLSSNLLTLFNPELVVVEPGQKILGLGDFIVSVAPACSGYEGIGLITAFLSLYMYINFKEFRFPRAFILFPLGISIIWLLNVVRITALVALGYHWSADVAIGGFHSQAGWIAFIVTSLALLWFAGRWSFVAKPNAGNSGMVQLGSPVSRSPDNSEQAVATLMPLIVLLGTVLVTSAISSEFVWLYPLRVIAVLLALIWVFPTLRLVPYRPNLLAFGCGIGVALIWIVMLFNSAPQTDRIFTENLLDAPVLWSGLWLLFRFLGAVIAVPIAEELAFRGYLLCKLSRSSSYTRGRLALSGVAVLVSSLTFGAMHDAWVAGTVAGLVYAFVRLRSQHIGDAITAHAVTNLVVFLFAAYSGQWSMI
ncbi:exosortase E/protease, VPEID-CTERM system [Microbulbifer bruguierae]|uniref:Exosortase E/protease, VPEID-CTERM system n=1 Tax=Microbulbifer bruguierae TaxID=3029061 RepID=A0ABY8NH93_9GAMM|nr:exosortase E/protease, VPEID-CTERM system [Microbulbifer bruguierae]WGL17779.1 exosortase E/protease, VPEID-CTERM system [Microbulbifer bruguierae]